MRTRTRLVVTLAAALVVAGGAVAGRFFWRKHAAEVFGASYAPVSEHYKQALFLTGQGDREGAVSEHQALLEALGAMRAARDGMLRDPRLAPDLERVEAVARAAGPLVQEGDLARAHLALEEIRPILAGILRRNGLSALKVALVEFHERMERIVEAGKARDAPAALAEVLAADEKLRAVESELDDARVKAIRAALDRVRALSVRGAAGELPDAVGALKSAFVKVYLAEG